MSPQPTLVALALAALAMATPVAAQEDFVARMEVEHQDDTPAASPVATAEAAGPVEIEEVVYATLDGAEVEGYLARPPGRAARGGLLLIHEWWGLNDNIRAVARRFAAEGYLALAVDLYEGESAEDREDASRLARAARDQPERLSENLRQAISFLSARTERIGVIGWCFGGGWSLQTALMAPDRIDAAVIYYGRVPTDPAELEPLQAPVLGIFGELDGGIPPERVRAFEAALETLGKEASIHIYPDADHAFANPSGTRYQKEAAEDAWARTLAFFSEKLR
ncbi:MAG: dienelactone hydrolase family protein [Thermoanaerobaculia bacterium]|nr:dienelactone hydrolase family protein [Thermoanaerobaculia bacterium]